MNTKNNYRDDTAIQRPSIEVLLDLSFVLSLIEKQSGREMLEKRNSDQNSNHRQTAENNNSDREMDKQDRIRGAFQGRVIFPLYNTRLWIIKDVVFDLNPDSLFQHR